MIAIPPCTFVTFVVKGLNIHARQSSENRNLQRLGWAL